MAWDPLFWVIFFILNMALVASNLFQIVCLSDLEGDYLNPYDAAARINALVVPEMLLDAVLCGLFLVTGHWVMFIIALPNACYNANLYIKQRHLIDVTEIFRLLNAAKKYRLIKLAFYVLLLVVVIIRLVLAVVNHVIDDDDNIHDFGLFH